MKLQQIVKKWYVILICAVLCSGGLYFEKKQIHTVIPETGDMTYIRVIKFDKVPVFTSNQSSKEIDMTNLVKSWSNLTELELKLKNDFKMRGLNVGWDNIGNSQKKIWLGEHFRVQNMGPGLYELIIQFPKKDAKDSQYIKDNSDKLMDTYQDYFIESAKMVTTDTNISTIKEIQTIDEDKVATSATVEKKYAIIGFILGIFIGIVIIMVWDTRKNSATIGR
jgi:hypothetical protein